MYKKKTIVAVAVLCTVMLISTGITSASITTKTQTYFEKITQKINAFNMSNNTKQQLIRVLMLGGVTAGTIAFLLIPNKHKIKLFTVTKVFALGVCLGVDIVLLANILANMPPAQQNGTNSTL
jgi:hypothetical protein